MRRATPSGSEKKARAASSVSLRSHDATHDSYDGTESVNWLRKRLEGSNPDLLRRMVGRFADSLMAAGVKSLRCADSGQGSTKRVSSPTDLAIDAAVEVYLTDRSTRRAQSVIHEMGIGRISTTQVAALTRSLNGVVADFRNRRLDGAPYTYLSLDAQARCHREGSRAVHAMPVVVRGLKPGGFFEMVDLDLVSGTDAAYWSWLLRGLVGRGLSGVRLVIADSHPGLREAIAELLPGAAWQRSRAHGVRELLMAVPEPTQPLVATLVSSIYDQPNRAAVWAQHGRIVEQLRAQF